ncbi:Metallo-hydrolase/oxidoreductase [Daedalea quercina L-15889]|uniref:Metallo-hydrolase/oxidoreductase n=1 Tax=Daedalea quercina L-15889 TaxID=1314783 RepID=A0A165PHV8_9APHY|nr:Metallo-hydrolase/oxidoreductase [Daedalea quercina L-15889]
MSLPPPRDKQAYCTISVLEGGFVDVPMAQIVDTAPPQEVMRLPCLAFLLKHSTRPDTFVFDLGTRKDWETAFAPALVAMIKKWYGVDVPQDVIDSLEKGGLAPADVDHVCISHVHFDHQGDPRVFTNATVIAGAGSRALLTPGYPADPDAHFHADLLPEGRTRLVSPDDPEMVSVGPFASALDYYGDGSLYIVDAPGHLPGHLALLARTSPDGAWLFVAGDACHDWRLLTGEAGIADGPRFGCVHRDKETAAETLAQVRALVQEPRVRVLLSHDVPWYDKNKGGDAFWPGSLSSF